MLHPLMQRSANEMNCAVIIELLDLASYTAGASDVSRPKIIQQAKYSLHLIIALYFISPIKRQKNQIKHKYVKIYRKNF